MKYKNLDFGKSLVYLPKSTVEIINNKSVTFTTGDIITLKIILHNERGDVLTDGGDFIKIWMTEKGAGSVGYVVDYGNGTYIGVIKALWSGSPHIKISLSFPKESIGLFVNYMYRNGMLRTLKGVFKNARGETDKTINHPEYSCRQINPSVTWNISSPVGYVYNKTWHNLLCQNTVEPSYNRYLSCLRNREIYMVGDSTVRQWLSSMAEIFNLALSVKRTSAALRGYHHLIKACSLVPLSVYEEHVMNAKDSIVKFLDRVPGAKIFIKGPHSLEYNNGVPYDFVRYLQDKIIFKIFDNIKHKVVYLNEWDMTVASESKAIHPSNDLIHQMVQDLLSYIC
ncbi:NXPE family member 3-like [Mytilus californianus]|uniref:NXPE family member 3-like n=1 Tax=Mytilus californianus TaxID=6549 RepID=UPI00224864DE|nr:NXPE family member 3-like [Mytilus californianus]